MIAQTYFYNITSSRWFFNACTEYIEGFIQSLLLNDSAFGYFMAGQHRAIICSSFLLTSFEPEFSFHLKDGEGAQEDPLKYIVFL
jgi:hypothetical protein